MWGSRSSIRLDLSLIQLPGMSETDSSGIVIPPAVAINHPVFLSPGNVQLEVCLEKTIIYDEEPLIIHVTIANNSNQAIKKMKVLLSFSLILKSLKSSLKSIEINQRRLYFDLNRVDQVDAVLHGDYFERREEN